jgi:hypothetical protein
MKKLHAVAVVVFLTATVSFLPGISSDAAISGGTARSENNSSAKATALKALGDSEENLAQLEKIHENTVQLFDKLSSLSSELAKKAGAVGKIAGQNNGKNSGLSGAQSSGSSSQDLMQATQQMQETQMSFNLQYLQLQEQMQNDSRQFTAVSNILKTKHDTAKSIIANIK